MFHFLGRRFLRFLFSREDSRRPPVALLTADSSAHESRLEGSPGDLQDLYLGRPLETP